ncbi:hypothetical protein [Methylomonas methanica]|uniref:Uncharacterized protein n=1 Tax=Methylomonas methanica (strain DSM 25384 / MC09) TaxID=857087 RepID=G0A655_METMM|nr:hypothetical protein [Methylomonas methanica]AEG00505.1 hypothetical protein Metme_2100 [Methylomonas methanica MC09]
MISMKKIAVLAVPCLFASPIWAGQVEYCKVVRSFDEKNLNAPPEISYEDCSGVAFLNYGKYFVEAACWPGAIDLLQGKCEPHEAGGEDDKSDSGADFEFGTAE